MLSKAEQEFIDSLRPGEWAVDNSCHRYQLKGKTITAYRWDAKDKIGKHHYGYSQDVTAAEVEARKITNLTLNVRH